MRITGGSLRGRRVAVPPGEIRPAMDRMRESLFAQLGEISGATFIDLFSGSGIVGMEAWSRGAYPVTLVEKDHRKRAVIRANLDGLTDGPTLLIEPVERFVARNARAGDIVYLDPPFPYRHRLDLMQRLARSRSVHDATRILIHVPTGDPLPPTIGTFVTVRETTYGGSLLMWYERAPRPAGESGGADGDAASQEAPGRPDN